MESEHYRMGFQDGSEGLPHKEFSCHVWQQHYNEGYSDGQKGIKGYFQEQVRNVLYRGGC
jgi:hypothetical protein